MKPQKIIQNENNIQKINRLELYAFLTSIEATKETKDKIVDIFIDNNLINQTLFKKRMHGSQTEKDYFLLMSCLPWVKSINGLNQIQTKKHKTKYQVPDFTLLVENSSKKLFPIYVEVKNCHSDNNVRKINKKQRTNLENYANDYRIDLLIATYWSKYQIWTHNSLSNFDSNDKISFSDAVKNDLSHIFHDLHVIIPPFYTKTYYHQDKNKGNLPFGDKGFFQECRISKDKIQWNNIEEIQAIIIDWIFNSDKDHICGTDDDGAYVIQKYSMPMMQKLSQLINIMFHKLHKHIEEKETTEDLVGRLEIIRFGTVDLFLKNSSIFKFSYQIPDKRTKHTDHIFSLAYGEDWKLLPLFKGAVFKKSELQLSISQVLKS